MATSLLLMASNHQNSTHDSTKEPLCGSDEYRPEPSKGRGRRSNPKGPDQKKQPQRGLGVAQLERLRLQEIKKMNEIPRLPEQNQHQFLQYHRSQALPFTVHDPFGSVPLRYGPEALHGALLSPRQHVTRSQTLPFTVGLPLMTGNRGGFNVLGDGGWLVTNQAAPFGLGAPPPMSSVLVGSPSETSKELSSMPNTHSVSDHSEVCLKRWNLDNVKELKTRSNRLSDYLWPINGSDFLGFGSQQSPTLTAESCDFSTRVAPIDTTNYVSRKNDECVEVVAVHRKGNVMTGKVFMEYEFFPGKNVRGTTSKELELPTVASVAVAGEASPLTATADYGDTASNSIDLSLKLSY
ncbi:hypothetical protein L6164_022516 [Bauhinia variegata]|uniref:Uncharacterized protein n=1 Tax=Bauhinia variegata TaxID=167791 RepID=A0ACB9MH77_BAUVA|nr:hypothetical protein L6164_022516 [Bauhinia variegata]